MSDKPPLNPFPHALGVTDIGDGRRFVETRDKGHTIKMIEPDGLVSMVICKDPPSAPPKPAGTGKYYVRHTHDGQEVIDPQGDVYAKTTDEAKAEQHRRLLACYDAMIANKAASGA